MVEWFESEKVEKAMPLVAEYNNNGDSLTNLLWSEDDKLIYRIFGVMKHSTIKKSHVEALMLQLVASGIFEYVVEGDKRKWTFGRAAGEVEKTTVKCYTLNEYWRGIDFIQGEHKKRRGAKKGQKKKRIMKHM